MYFCIVKYKPKNAMNKGLFHLFIPANLTKFAFGLCFYVLVLFTPLLKQLILLVKQAFVCKTLIFTPPPSTSKQYLLGVGSSNLYRGCSLKAMFYLRTHLPLVSI